MTVLGKIKDGVVVFQSGHGDALPDGTLVRVTPVDSEIVSPSALPASIEVSREQKAALLSLIGIWKTEQPPDDVELEKIVEGHRMKKYG